jgi:metal-dependent amidase/aminoacylase/carboxypeptidase family protein
VLLRDRLRAQIAGIGAGYGIEADVEWEDVSNPLIGDQHLSALVADHVGEYASLQRIQPSMAGEDFSDYAHAIPAVFAFIGSNGRPGHHNLHSPKFLGLDECLPTEAAAAAPGLNRGGALLRSIPDRRLRPSGLGWIHDKQRKHISSIILHRPSFRVGAD